MASMCRTISRAISRKDIKKVKKAQKKVAAGTRSTTQVRILKAGNQTEQQVEKKPTAAEKFKSMIQKIVKKVKSWVA